jgi:hypothetical protein
VLFDIVVGMHEMERGNFWRCEEGMEGEGEEKRREERIAYEYVYVCIDGCGFEEILKMYGRCVYR